MKSFIVLLSYCFLVLLLFASPVLAKIPSGVCCTTSGDCPEGNYVCDAPVSPDCENQGLRECFLVGPYEPGEDEEGEGIINPVIGLFGTQRGELTIAYLLATFLRLSLVAAGILLLIYLIFSGIQWLTSGGEKTAVAAAKERMTAAFIGLILIVLVLVIIDLINRILGLDILHPTLPTPE